MAKLASGSQLWRANAAGRLTITDKPVEPIDHQAAWALIQAVVAEYTQASEVTVLEDNA